MSKKLYSVFFVIVISLVFFLVAFMAMTERAHARLPSGATGVFGGIITDVKFCNCSLTYRITVFHPLSPRPKIVHYVPGRSIQCEYYNITRTGVWTLGIDRSPPSLCLKWKCSSFGCWCVPIAIQPWADIVLTGTSKGGAPGNYIFASPGSFHPLAILSPKALPGLLSKLILQPSLSLSSLIAQFLLPEIQKTLASHNGVGESGSDTGSPENGVGESGSDTGSPEGGVGESGGDVAHPPDEDSGSGSGVRFGASCPSPPPPQDFPPQPDRDPPSPPSDPQCSDGIDNDGDGLRDYPDDPDCDSATDNSEAPSGGTCPLGTGPCSPENLAKACPVWDSNEASQVCQAESGSSPTSKSGTDVVNDNGDCISKYGTSPKLPFSGGLFQINIKANDIGGLGCPSAFSGIFKWSGGVVVTNTVKIENCPLYDKCMGVTFTPSTNIARACDLYKGRGNWGDWLVTAIKCNLPH